jgi:hypothetical protein
MEDKYGCKELGTQPTKVDAMVETQQSKSINLMVMLTMNLGVSRTST